MIGQKLRDLREERDLTQVELAKRARLPRSYIAAVENRNIEDLSYTRLTALARGFAISPDELADILGLTKANRFDAGAYLPEVIELLEEIDTFPPQVQREIAKSLRSVISTIRSASLQPTQ